ncbi:MAG TPA: NADH-quinone oxidoreductase subunit C [Acidimicrobiia bacterium]|nr:NADH-quinone oxidoreductase subunit C [Acidimicrobiia bacterium]
MSPEPLEGLKERFTELEWHLSHGQEVVRVEREQLLELATAAQETGFDMLADVTAVDWYRSREPRFDVVINLLSMSHRARLRILVGLARDDTVVPSLVPLWPGANFAEREVFDFFGIVFEGHPDLTRILMPDDWDGFPLRKDYDTGAVPVQFKASHKVS